MAAIGSTRSAPVSRATRSPRVASSCQSSSSQRSCGQATRQPEPAHVACRQSLHAAERAERLPERRHTGRVALGEPRRQAVEEQVDRAWRLRRRRRGLSGLGRLADARLVAEATGEHRRRRAPRGRSRGPSRRRAARGAGPHRAAAAARRCRACGRTRSARAAAPAARAGARRAGRARRSPAARAPRPTPPASNFACAAASARLPARRRVGGQLGRPLQERRGRRRARRGPAPGRPSAPARRPPPRRARPPRARDARRDDRDRRPDRSPRPAPDAPPGGRGSGRRPVDRRADERMPEPHPDPELDQPGLLGRPARVASDPELLGRAPQQAHVADRLGRRHQQQALGLARKRPDPLQEGLLDAAGQRPRVGKPEPARELRRRQPTRQLQQRERVAARLGDDPVAHALVQPPRHRRRQQRAGVVVGEPADDQLRQAGELVDVGWARAPRTPCAIRSASRRRATNASVCAEARSSHCASSTRHTSGCSSAASASRLRTARADQEAIRGGAVLQPERHAQRVALRAGQPVRAGRASARTADAARRTRAPSRTRRPRPGRSGTPTPARRRTPAAPSCRPPPRRAGPAPSSPRPGRAAAGGPAASHSLRRPRSTAR